jgi:hypothetical protein
MAVAINNKERAVSFGKEKTMRRQRKTNQRRPGQAKNANDTRAVATTGSRTNTESKLDKVLQQPLRPQEHAEKASDNAGCCGRG